MKLKQFIWTLGVLMVSCSLYAQKDTMMVMDPIQADRPDQTETAHLVPRGYFQMEHGFSIEETKPGFVYSYPSSLWKFGLTENFELRLVTHYTTIQRAPSPDQNGFLPIEVGFKSRLGEQKGVIPKMSFIGHLIFPGVVAEDFETTYFAPNLTLVFLNRVSDFFSIGYNAGIRWDGENAEPHFTYSLAPGIAISNNLGLYAEIYGSTPQREAGPIELRADAGITYLIGNDFMLDLSAGQGITEDAPERYVAFGISYRFKL